MSVQMKRRRRPGGETGRVLAVGRHVGRAPGKTGTPHWFRLALNGRATGRQNRKLRELLVKLPLEFLKKFDIPESTIEALQEAGVKNVWELSLAPSSLIRRIRIDSRRLVKLRRVLVENAVRVNWSVA
jgi:hypothetical protein